MEQTKTLRTYGGTKVRTTVYTPRTLDDLRKKLRIEAGKRRVTFRCTGHAFDTQSINDELVISLAELENFRAIRVDVKRRTVTVGAGATWGEILAATTAHGLVPYVMPSSSSISAGGSVSAHVFSRFSAHVGREGAHVDSLRFMTVDGVVDTCSRQQNSDLFLGAIGGLGYLGLILEITYRLHDPEIEPGRVAVESDFLPILGITDLAAKLVECVSGNGKMRHDAPNSGLGRRHDHRPYAVTACLYLNKKRQGVLTRSHYVAADASQLRPCLEHSPRSLAHQLLQLAAIFPWTRKLGWWFVLNFRFRHKQTAIDAPHGYSFFEDGNRIARGFLRWFGFSVPLRQQTYLIPWDAKHPEESSRRLVGFLSEVDARLDSKNLVPSIMDIGYLGDNEGDEFYLSSSHRFSGFALSIAFEKPCGKMRKEEEALRDISVMCQMRGGRVHLVKHVFADNSMLPSMYPGLSKMIAVKCKHDPSTRLANEFLTRVLPAMTQCQNPGAITRANALGSATP